jgi:crotonobetainyl-CoA:carnitine CoA-transferase CaiB-like acyl-CoA transferase
VPQVVAPLKFSVTALSFDRPPPLLGEHTAEVLSERLGMDAARLRELEATGIIQTRAVA